MLKEILLSLVVLSLIVPSVSLISASTDDGYVYPDDASEEEKEEIDEQEKEAWEDAGKPGEEEAKAEAEVKEEEEEEEEEKTPNPYCDLVPENYNGNCHDRKDYSDDTKLYPCNDGTNKVKWQDCKDATSKKDSRSHDNDKKDKIIKNIKNVEIVKKIVNSDSSDSSDSDIEQTIVAINYDEGTGINCVFMDDDEGVCETFTVTIDKGKEPLLQIIPF